MPTGTPKFTHTCTQHNFTQEENTHVRVLTTEEFVRAIFTIFSAVTPPKRVNAGDGGRALELTVWTNSSYTATRQPDNVRDESVPRVSSILLAAQLDVTMRNVYSTGN